MTTLDARIAALIAREGGYVDHPDDLGGPTNFGITEDVARAAGFEGPVRALTRAQAGQIYRAQYWDAPGFARVAAIMPSVAEELFDSGVNMGVSTAIGFLQRALNALNHQGTDWPDTPLTRRIDAPTCAGLAALLRKHGRDGEKVLNRALNALQGARYIELAERRKANESFVYGWLKHRVSL
jgi:lysozyme family protein